MKHCYVAEDECVSVYLPCSSRPEGRGPHGISTVAAIRRCFPVAHTLFPRPVADKLTSGSFFFFFSFFELAYCPTEYFNSSPEINFGCETLKSPQSVSPAAPVGTYDVNRESWRTGQRCLLSYVSVNPKY